MRISPARARKLLKTRPFYRDLQATSPWNDYREHFESNAEKTIRGRDAIKEGHMPQSAAAAGLEESTATVLIDAWAAGPLEQWESSGPGSSGDRTGAASMGLSKPDLSHDQKENLLRSLAIFQLGETGEGRVVQEAESSDLSPLDGDYRRCLSLFVREEGKHARMLGEILQALGGASIQSNGTHRLFHFARRLMGLRLKLMVLLSAEIIGCECYGALADSLPPGDVSRQLRIIQKDEIVHLGFHGHFFHLLGGNPYGRWLLLALYYPVCICASASVIIDQRKTFRSFRIPLFAAVRSFWKRIEQGKRYILRGCPTPEVCR